LAPNGRLFGWSFFLRFFNEYILEVAFVYSSRGPTLVSVLFFRMFFKVLRPSQLCFLRSNSSCTAAMGFPPPFDLLRKPPLFFLNRTTSFNPPPCLYLSIPMFLFCQLAPPSSPPLGLTQLRSTLRHNFLCRSCICPYTPSLFDVVLFPSQPPQDDGRQRYADPSFALWLQSIFYRLLFPIFGRPFLLRCLRTTPISLSFDEGRRKKKRVLEPRARYANHGLFSFGSLKVPVKRHRSLPPFVMTEMKCSILGFQAPFQLHPHPLLLPVEVQVLPPGETVFIL